MNFISKHAQSFNELFYMPHIHCLGGDWLLASGLVLTNEYIQIVYAIIALICFYIGRQATTGGQFQKMMNSVAWVFIFCGFNYMMLSIVVWVPAYWEQLIVALAGAFVTTKAIYHLLRVPRSNLKIFIELFFDSLKKSGL